ncbi:MAG: hypothetical protein EON60_04870 [Alphaproteobacteria bacterium]|nr:MAG: hypothetical protein EON60_04870 [Alphaproteobacteria bacterium]
MKLFRACFYVVIAAAILMVEPAFAVVGTVPPGTTDGKLGELLATQLYCNSKSMVEGSLGLVIGVLIMFSALWSLIRGGKVMPAVVSILFGASITALPSIIESAFTSLGTLMTDSGMAGVAATFTPPTNCSSLDSDIAKEYEIIEENREKGYCDGGRLDCL